MCPARSGEQLAELTTEYFNKLPKSFFRGHHIFLRHLRFTGTSEMFLVRAFSALLILEAMFTTFFFRADSFTVSCRERFDYVKKRNYSFNPEVVKI